MRVIVKNVLGQPLVLDIQLVLEYFLLVFGIESQPKLDEVVIWLLTVLKLRNILKRCCHATRYQFLDLIVTLFSIILPIFKDLAEEFTHDKVLDIFVYKLNNG